MARAAVIGAGLAGLTAARALADAGVAVTVFEKSRGLGGRLATRRTADGLDFDHGAPLVGPGAGDFAAFLLAAVAAGDAAPWGGGTVGLPGMSGLVRGLAAGLDIRFGTEVATVAPEGARWRAMLPDGAQGADAGVFEAVLVAAPAPQTVRLCAAIPAIAGPAASARMAPCWTLMAAWTAPVPGPDDRAGKGATARLVRSSSKPGRAGAPDRWVAHADAAWTLAHLEDPAEAVAAAMLAEAAAALGADPDAALHARAHRWRYARATGPLGAPCLAHAGLIAAGDWLPGGDAAGAHASGLAAAAAALARLG